MNKYIVFGFLAVGLMLNGCSKQADNNQGEPGASVDMQQDDRKTVQTASEAISLAENFETIKEKKEYLISQAENFYKSEKFQQAVEVAQYVIQSLDKDSIKAKQLLEDAKQKLEAKAQAKVADVKNALGGLGK